MSDKIWDGQRLRFATEAAGVALWSWNVDTDQCAMDARAFELWGLPVRDVVTFEELSARIHPADLDKVRAAFSSTRDLTGSYELEFRILHGDEVRWVSARGQGDDEGISHRMMYGVYLDVTERKLAEEARETVTGEMQHRIKNLFSIASALIGIAARGNETTEYMAADLRSRLAGLASAHDLIRPRLRDQKPAVQLQDLLAALLKPYDENVGASQRIRISVPDILAGEHSTTSFAMIIHELATNAAKYGAFSTADGRLDVSGREDDGDVELVWTERGGPPATAQTRDGGFGRVMSEKMIKQIGGSITHDWRAEGVVVRLRMSKARLGA